MLYIDDKEFIIIEQKIYVGDYAKNGEKGYNICMQLVFVNTNSNEKGYINLDVGFEKNDDIKCFLNKEYCGTPFNSDDNQDIYIEVFDTEKFLDTEIEGIIIIELENIIENNKIKTSFEVNDELIKIKFDGFLDINYIKPQKNTFCSS